MHDAYTSHVPAEEFFEPHGWPSGMTTGHVPPLPKKVDEQSPTRHRTVLLQG
jgi:hypothetical protein